MQNIRRAEARDIPRIAEILVFTKRMNYRSIFHDDLYSFNELQVGSTAEALAAHPRRLDGLWVYCDDFVKGLMEIEGGQLRQLYVDHFFESMGIGGQLIEFAIRDFGVRWLWALEKNVRARAFYARHGFFPTGEWKFEEGTVERLVKLARD